MVMGSGKKASMPHRRRHHHHHHCTAYTIKQEISVLSQAKTAR